MVLLCRNNATINTHVKTQNQVKHRVWHTDPWPDTTQPKSLTRWPGDPKTRFHLCMVEPSSGSDNTAPARRFDTADYWKERRNGRNRLSRPRKLRIRKPQTAQQREQSLVSLSLFSLSLVFPCLSARVSSLTRKLTQPSSTSCRITRRASSVTAVSLQPPYSRPSALDDCQAAAATERA